MANVVGVKPMRWSIRIGITELKNTSSARCAGAAAGASSRTETARMDRRIEEVEQRDATAVNREIRSARRRRSRPSNLDGLPLSQFSPDVRNWFHGAFEGPTPAQEQAWPAIASGEHVLLSAPTGSGKTLAAFLWGIDRLSQSTSDLTRLVYVSPLKALSYDIERNLRAPLR